MTSDIFQIDNWPIKKKLRLSAYAYAATVLMLILLWVLTVNVKGKISNDLAEMSKAEGFFQQLRIELLEWKDSLEKTVILDIPFQGEMDPKKCKFGILFYSYRPPIGGIDPLLKDVEELHFQSHRLTQEIIGAKNKLNVLHNYSSMLAPNLKNFNGQIEELMRMLGEEQQKSMAAMKELDMVFYAAIALFLILSITLFFFQSRLSESISEPLEFLTSATAKIAQGDLKVKLDVGPRRDEIGRLEASFKNMVDNMDKMNARLLQSEKMSAVGKLASSVGHELRNPLGAIQNSLYYVREFLSSEKLLEKDPSLLDFMDIADNEIKNSTSIISELLDFSRVGKVFSQETNVNELLASLKTIIPFPDNVRLVELYGDHIPKVEIDPQKMRQVFINLATNAIQAMPEGGTLTIATHRVRGEGPETLDIDFIDEGTGIDPKLIDKIFEPLFTTKDKGTGLGLAISNNIVQAHGGSLSVSSKPGKGTKFTIRLPIKRADEPV